MMKRRGFFGALAAGVAAVVGVKDEARLGFFGATRATGTRTIDTNAAAAVTTQNGPSLEIKGGEMTLRGTLTLGGPPAETTTVWKGSNGNVVVVGG